MKPLLPRIRFVPVMPQDVISSDRGAYFPASRTIVVSTAFGLAVTLEALAHEVIHHVVEVAFGTPVAHRAFHRLVNAVFRQRASMSLGPR